MTCADGLATASGVMAGGACNNLPVTGFAGLHAKLCDAIVANLRSKVGLHLVHCSSILLHTTRYRGRIGNPARRTVS